MENNAKQLAGSVKKLGDALKDVTEIFNKAKNNLSPEERKEFDKKVKDEDVMKEAKKKAEEALKNMDFDIKL